MENRDYRNFENQLTDSLKYGFIHNAKYQNNMYSPKVIINNPDTGEYVLNDIQKELRKSESFSINVAFVTIAGIGMLKTHFLDFASRGGTGRILVSPYLGFNDPKALYELLKLKNIEIRMSADDLNMHAKVYIFNHGDAQSVIVGSSNLTHSALKVNYEWNLKLTSTEHGDLIQRTKQDFDSLWEKSTILTKEEIEKYVAKRTIQINTDFNVNVPAKDEYPIIKPNKMQKKAVESLSRIRKEDQSRALVISATGERVIIVMGALNVILSRVSGTLTKYYSYIA